MQDEESVQKEKAVLTEETVQDEESVQEAKAVLAEKPVQVVKAVKVRTDTVETRFVEMSEEKPRGKRKVTGGVIKKGMPEGGPTVTRRQSRRQAQKRADERTVRTQDVMTKFLKLVGVDGQSANSAEHTASSRPIWPEVRTLEGGNMNWTVEPPKHVADTAAVCGDVDTEWWRAYVERWDNGHNDTCQLCDRGGALICCDFCNLVFHLSCLPMTHPFRASRLSPPLGSKRPRCHEGGGSSGGRTSARRKHDNDDFVCPECLDEAAAARDRKTKEMQEANGGVCAVKEVLEKNAGVTSLGKHAVHHQGGQDAQAEAAAVLEFIRDVCAGNCGILDVLANFVEAVGLYVSKAIIPSCGLQSCHLQRDEEDSDAREGLLSTSDRDEGREQRHEDQKWELDRLAAAKAGD